MGEGALSHPPAKLFKEVVQMRERGFRAEDFAEKYLKKQGYKIVKRNFSCRWGEIDMIAEKDEYTVFVEVKLRKNDSFGGGAAAVDQRKQARIKKTAAVYLSGLQTEPNVRFDVVVITAEGEKIKKENVEVIENAFW